MLLPNGTKKITWFFLFAGKKKKRLIYLITHCRDLANLANVITKKELEFSEPGRHKAEIQCILC